MKPYHPSKNAALERLCADLFPKEVLLQMATAPSRERGDTILLQGCFRFEIAAQGPLNDATTVRGPAGASGTATEARLSVRRTEQGDLLICLEGDEVLLGRKLRISGGKADIVLQLNRRLGRAFAVTTIAEAEYNDLVRQTNGEPICNWE